MIGLVHNRMVTQALYTLEKRFSKIITINAQISVLNDAFQGVSVPEVATVDIRAIVMPEDNVRQHIYNASYLATGRDFTYGAMFDEVATPIIVKKSRLVGLINQYGYTGLSTNDSCIIDGVRYDFRIVSLTADKRAYHILAKQSPAVDANEQT